MVSSSFFRPVHNASGIGAAVLAVCLLLALSGVHVPAPAAPADGQVAPGTAAQSERAETGSDTVARRQQAAAKRLVDAATVARTLVSTPGMPTLLSGARGIYIVPTYARAALGIGGVGGSGVLLVRRPDGNWGNPAFFNIGGINIGLQAGAEGGALALLLLNDKAVEGFRKRNNFSLSADAGVTVVDFARMARGSTRGDVVAWSGGKGLFGNAVTIGINDIRFNQRLTEAYYGKPATALQAIDGMQLDPQADPLRQALAVPAATAGAGAR